MKHVFLLFFTFISINFLSAQCGGSTTQVINEDGGSTPAGWVVDDQRGSYWLVTDDAGSGPNGEVVITSDLDVSAYGEITVNVRVATFGSGTAHPATIEFSTNGGASYDANVFTTATPSSSSYIDGGDFVFTVPAATTQLVLRIGKDGSSGRDVRIQDLFVCGEAVSACPVSLTYNTPVCDAITLGSTDTYGYTVDFTGAGQGSGTYLTASSNGVITGDDPDLVAAGTIIVSGITEGTDDLFEFDDFADCSFSETVTSPDCDPVCPLIISNLSVTCDVLTSGDDNYTYTYDFSGGGQGAGTYTLTSLGGTVGGDDPNLLATGVISVTGNDESSDDLFEIASSACAIFETITAPECEPLPEIYINEMVSDPNGSGFHLNTNHDYDSGGNPIEDGSDDEMVELIWLGSGALDLTGWSIWDGFGMRHTFGNVQMTPTNDFAVVFGGGDVSNISSIIPDAYFTTASSGNLGLNNGDDVIELRDNNGTVIRRVTYGGATFTTTDISGYSDNTESSWGRNPDGTGSFVQVASITPAETFFTPGESNLVQSALPVTYDYFNVTPVNTNQALISWATTQEINNERFDIQRSVNNGEFETIASVSGQGTVNKKTEYKFLDQKTEVGMNYYRVRQLDFEGRSAYSAAKAIQIGRLVDIRVYPSLVSDYLSYNIDQESAKLILMSIDGSVYKEMYINDSGEVDMTAYAPGMYTVTINTSSTTKTVRIIKI